MRTLGRRALPHALERHPRKKSEGPVETHQEKTQKPDEFETEPSTFGLWAFRRNLAALRQSIYTPKTSQRPDFFSKTSFSRRDPSEKPMTRIATL